MYLNVIYVIFFFLLEMQSARCAARAVIPGACLVLLKNRGRSPNWRQLPCIEILLSVGLPVFVQGKL